MPLAETQILAIRQSVQHSYAELNELLDSFPNQIADEKLYQKPAESAWTIMEILAHIVEIMPYWAKEVARLVNNPGQPFGRTAEDKDRLAAVSEHAYDSLAQIRTALPGSYTPLAEALQHLKESDLELTGIHSKYGECTLAWFMSEFITDHLHKHLFQIKAALDVLAE